MYNKAVRLITGIPRRERITPQLIRLHWLPVKARIFYKICVMTYQALHTGKPGYLKDYLVPFGVELDVQVRHGDEVDRLSVFRCNLELGKRAFEYNAPRMYNSLPPEVKHSENMQLFKK